MKLIISQYFASLRERDELDAVLPDLLSELGFEIVTRPRRGTRQAGVDVAAIGPDPDADGQKTLFLFTVKAGDLGRRDWNGSQQAVLCTKKFVPHGAVLLVNTPPSAFHSASGMAIVLRSF